MTVSIEMKLTRKQLRKIIMEVMIKPDLKPKYKPVLQSPEEIQDYLNNQQDQDDEYVDMLGSKLDQLYSADTDVNKPLENTWSAEGLHSSITGHEKGYTERMADYATVYFNKPESIRILNDYMDAYLYSIKEELSWWAENETDSFDDYVHNLFSFKNLINILTKEMHNEETLPENEREMLNQLRNIKAQYDESYTATKVFIANKFKKIFREKALISWADWRAYFKKDMNITDPREFKIVKDYLDQYHPGYKDTEAGEEFYKAAESMGIL